MELPSHAPVAQHWVKETLFFQNGTREGEKDVHYSFVPPPKASDTNNQRVGRGLKSEEEPAVAPATTKRTQEERSSVVSHLKSLAATKVVGEA